MSEDQFVLNAKSNKVVPLYNVPPSAGIYFKKNHQFNCCLNPSSPMPFLSLSLSLLAFCTAAPPSPSNLFVRLVYYHESSRSIPAAKSSSTLSGNKCLLSPPTPPMLGYLALNSACFRSRSSRFQSSLFSICSWVKPMAKASSTVVGGPFAAVSVAEAAAPIIYELEE